MTIYIECPKCRRMLSRKSQECNKCSAPIPAKGKVFWIQIKTPPKGKYTKRLGVCSPTYAEQQHNIALVKRAEGRLIEPDKNENRVTVTDIQRRFGEYLLSTAASKQYQRDTWRHLRVMQDLWGDIEVREITQQMFMSFRSRLLGKGKSPSTTNKYLATIRAAWSVCFPGQYNPFKLIKPLKEKPNLIVEILTDEQRDGIIEESTKYGPTIHAIFVLLIGTGLRKNEIVRLRKDQVNLDLGIINVRQKGGTSLARVLSRECLDALRDVPANDSEYCFVSAKTGEPYNKFWTGPWEKIKAKLGIDPRFRIHGLRHDAGYRIYNATGDLRLAKEALGHASMTTTIRYSKMDIERMRLASRVLETGTSNKTSKLAIVNKTE